MIREVLVFRVDRKGRMETEGKILQRIDGVLCAGTDIVGLNVP